LKVIGPSRRRRRRTAGGAAGARHRPRRTMTVKLRPFETRNLVAPLAGQDEKLEEGRPWRMQCAERMPKCSDFAVGQHAVAGRDRRRRLESLQGRPLDVASAGRSSKRSQIGLRSDRVIFGSGFVRRTPTGSRRSTPAPSGRCFHRFFRYRSTKLSTYLSKARSTACRLRSRSASTGSTPWRTSMSNRSASLRADSGVQGEPCVPIVYRRVGASPPPILYWRHTIRPLWL
jgi:hypothetical protein